MLKFFFWILLFANAVLLAAQNSYFDAFLSSGREPARLDRQLNADKIKRVPAPEPAAPPVAATAAGVVDEKQQATAACVEFGDFTAEDAKRFSTQLADLALGERLRQHTVEEVSSHLVYIPPLADKESAEKKAAELRRLGIDDFYVIQDNSPMRWGISLGLFKVEETARAHLASLNQKGVRSARIAQRSVTRTVFQFRDLAPEQQQELDKLQAGYPKQEMRPCESGQ